VVRPVRAGENSAHDRRQAEPRDRRYPARARDSGTFLKQGVAAAPGSPEELGDWVKSELARWTPVIQAAGIKAD